MNILILPVGWFKVRYFRGENEGSYFTIFWKGEECFQNETMDIFIAGEGNYYCLTGRGAEEREFYWGRYFFSEREFCVRLVTFSNGLGMLYREIVVGEFSTQLVSKLGTCLLTIARCL